MVTTTFDQPTFKQVWAKARNTEGTTASPLPATLQVGQGQNALLSPANVGTSLSLQETAKQLFGEGQAQGFEQWYVKANLDTNNDGTIDTTTELPAAMAALAQVSNADGHLLQQRMAYVGQLASYAGLSPAEASQVQQRLSTGQYSVAAETPGETLNLLQQAQTSPEQLNRLATAATTHLNDYQAAGKTELKTALQVLATNGVLPNWLGEARQERQARQAFRFYNAAVAGQDASRGLTGFNLQQVDVTPGPQGEPVFNPSPVPPQAVAEGAPAVYLKDMASYRNQPLPNQQQVMQALASVLPSVAQQKGGMASLANEVVSNLNSAQGLQQALNPVIEGFKTVLGLPNVQVSVIPSQPSDNPGLYGAYLNGQVSLYQTALKGTYQQAMAMGQSPEQAAVDVLASVSQVLSHELSHAFQAEANQNPERYGYEATTPRLQDYADNAAWYTPSSFSTVLLGNPNAYMQQPLEQDAWTQAGPVSHGVWQASGVQPPAESVSKALYQANPFAQYSWR